MEIYLEAKNNSMEKIFFMDSVDMKIYNEDEK